MPIVTRRTLTTDSLERAIAKVGGLPAPLAEVEAAYSRKVAVVGPFREICAADFYSAIKGWRRTREDGVTILLAPPPPPRQRKTHHHDVSQLDLFPDLLNKRTP